MCVGISATRCSFIQKLPFMLHILCLHMLEEGHAFITLYFTWSLSRMHRYFCAN